MVHWSLPLGPTTIVNGPLTLDQCGLFQRVFSSIPWRMSLFSL